MDNLKNMALFTAAKDGVPKSNPSNAPARVMQGRRKQLYRDQTGEFIRKQLGFAPDMWDCECEGLDSTDFFKKTKAVIRAAEMINANQTVSPEEYRTIIFESPKVDYVPKGAKVTFYNNVWIVTGTANIGSVTGGGYARRCNAIWYRRDFYGNILAEPFVVLKPDTRANDNKYNTYVVLAENYVNCIMQKNAFTENLRENTRIILGSSAYMVRGLNDFTEEFSDEGESTRLLYFSLYRAEPNADDDMENKIACGADFTAAVAITGASEMTTGSTQTLAATFIRNGEAEGSDEAYPISFEWTSSDTNVATVDANGNVTAIGAGTSEIRAVLAQNAEVQGNFTITVKNADTSPNLAFTGNVPQSIRQYDTAEITAAYFEDGKATDRAVEFSLEGAGGCYKASTDGNKISITAQAISKTPLKITASCEGISAVAEINLIGF